MTRDECTAEINSIIERFDGDSTFARRYQLVGELKTLLRLRFSLIPKIEVFSIVSNTCYYLFVSFVYKVVTFKINKEKQQRIKAFAKDFNDILNGKF